MPSNDIGDCPVIITVGYDLTEDANAPRVVCADCGEGCGAPTLHRGEEWGGGPALCMRCGSELDLSVVYADTMLWR